MGEREETKQVAKTRENALFAAANSGEGFKSFYGEIFSPARLLRRYLIKGGAGSGKSSLMRRVAETLSSRGHRVEYYYCSSDYTSLDGIVIDGRVALVDSTAPHIIEPELAGAVDEIVDTGLFWDSRALASQRVRIAELSDKKRECYKGAYRYLEAALAVDRRSRELMRRYIRTEKLRKAAARAVASIPDGNRYSLRVGIRSSVGMKGRYSLDTYENQAERLYIVSDSYRSGGLFISALIDEARRKHCRVCVSYDPVNTDVPDAVLFEESGVGFVVCEGEGSEEIAGRINMKRFFSFPHATADSSRAKAEFRADRRLYDGLLGCACEKLAQAGEAHFALESIYGKCMDFEAESRYCNSLAQRVAELLEGKE
jgi:hypothetical protein